MPPMLVVAECSVAAWQLCDALREAGWPVTLVDDVVAAMNATLADPPACIVCDSELAEGDGYALARWLRAHDAEPLASTALVMRTPQADLDARMRGYRSGADVCLSRALPTRETVAQVEALVRFAMREKTAIEGSLSAAPLTTLLSVLELEGRTGIFEVESDSCAAELELCRGEAVAARLLGSPAPPLEAVRAMLGWQSGRFAFRALPAVHAARRASSPVAVRELLAEAARLHDEATAA